MNPEDVRRLGLVLAAGVEHFVDVAFSPLLSKRASIWRMTADWKKHIVSDPEILRGKPRLKGTRIPVGVVLGYLAAGKTAEQIIGEFPDLTREQIAACLDYARELAEFEAVV